MRQAIIAMRKVRDQRGQHPGLLLQRYLAAPATGKQGDAQERLALLQAAIRASGDTGARQLYTRSFERWKSSWPELTRSCELHVAGRLIVGLGADNVLETGIRLHHTYGMPLIPGSALKGLAAHYCDEVWGQTDAQFRNPTGANKSKSASDNEAASGGADNEAGRYHRLLFGTTDDAGCVVFHDAWFVPDSANTPLCLDVMTPHHPKWVEGEVPPTDYDSPVPVPFLSVTGKFLIAVSWQATQHKEAEKWLELVLTVLRQALAEWGVGAKTTSGYGRLVEELANTTSAAAASRRNPAGATGPTKRPSGTPTRVRILGTRPKGGFEVQEDGYPQGALTVGNPPADLQINEGDEVEVQVHNDDPNRPQYRWPTAPKQSSQGKKKDKGGRGGRRR